MQQLTDRQRREVEYHQDHAVYLQSRGPEPLNWEVLNSLKRRWWNAYWESWTFLLGRELQGKIALVVGCGTGTDALLLAKLGAKVSAFDLSPEMIELARSHARETGLDVDFSVMPAEAMTYPDNFFDLTFVRDILHHVEITSCMNEIVRVSKPDAFVLYNEIYSHSVTELIRKSSLVERVLYPLMQNFVYKGEKPYITKDERKLNERDIKNVNSFLKNFQCLKFFNFVVTRLVPDKYDALNKLDRALLMAMGRFGAVVAGRIVCAGQVSKHS